MKELETPTQMTNMFSLRNATTLSKETTLGTSFINKNLEYNINLVGRTIAELDIYMIFSTPLVKAAPIPAAGTTRIFDVASAAFHSYLRIEFG